MHIETLPPVLVTTTGGAGTAVGAAYSQAVNGFLLDVFLDYHASAPATTDVTIAYDTNPGTTITVISNNKTDGIYVPRIQACDAAGAAIAGIYDRYVISGRLKVSVAQADALAPAVTAWFRVLVIE